MMSRPGAGAAREAVGQGGPPMLAAEDTVSNRPGIPWNKGRVVGQKRPLKPKDVWTIRVRLQIKSRKHDLAMFNLAIDSKLRGCDLVALRVDDVCAGGRVRDRATVVQKKTGRPVQFEITENKRSSVQEWLHVRSSNRGPYLFPRVLTEDRPENRGFFSESVEVVVE